MQGDTDRPHVFNMFGLIAIDMFEMKWFDML